VVTGGAARGVWRVVELVRVLMLDATLLNKPRALSVVLSVKLFQFQS
jgi:hypothetical protein